MDESTVVGDISQLTEEDAIRSSPCSVRTHVTRISATNSPKQLTPPSAVRSMRSPHSRVSHASAQSSRGSPQGLWREGKSPEAVPPPPMPQQQQMQVQQAPQRPPPPSAEDMERYEAEVLRVLEGLKGECEAQKDVNERLVSELSEAREEAAARAEEAGALRADLAQRTALAEKLQGIVHVMPTPAEIEALEQRAAEDRQKAGQWERLHGEAVQVAKPLHQKLHEQEKYIVHLESQLSTHTANSQSTQQAVSQMAVELANMKQQRSLEVRQQRRAVVVLQAQHEAACMEVEDARARAGEAQSRHDATQRDYMQHAQGVLRLKDEQLKLAQYDMGVKDEQLAESRNLIKDMMNNVQDTLRRLEEAKADRDATKQQLGNAEKRVTELESATEAAKDTRKQVRKEVHGMLSQAKETEQQWQHGKKRYEEMVDKQRAKVQTLTQQRAKLEEGLAEAKAAVKRSTEKNEDMQQAVHRAFQQVCLAPGLEAIDDSMPIRSERINPKQKLQSIIDRASATLQTAVGQKAELSTTRHELQEARRRGEDLEAHAAWLEGEWNAAKQRRAQVEEEGKRLRDEGSAYSKSNRELRSENERLKDQVSGVENAVAQQADRMDEREQVHHDEVACLRKRVEQTVRQCEEQDEALQKARVDEGELLSLRTRIQELTHTVETLQQRSRDEAAVLEAAEREKEAAFEAKNKHQKNTTKHLAELKKLRTETAEGKKKLESALRTTEQLRKQVSLKDTENKALQEKAASATAASERKDKDIRREALQREAVAKESDELRKQLKSLIVELERIQDGVKTEGDMEVERLRALLHQREGEMRVLRGTLEDETELRLQLAEEVDELRRGEQRRDREMRERALATPARAGHPAERAHQKKQLQNRHNTASGVDTPYAVLHRNHAAATPGTSPHRYTAHPSRTPSTARTPPSRDGRDGGAASERDRGAPATEPRQVGRGGMHAAWTPPAFDQHNIVVSPPDVKKALRSPSVVGVTL